jgi:hypothetical protein
MKIEWQKVRDKAVITAFSQNPEPKTWNLKAKTCPYETA